VVFVILRLKKKLIKLNLIYFSSWFNKQPKEYLFTMSSEIKDLSIHLLERDGVEYLRVLESLDNEGVSKDQIKDKLDEKLYHGWYGNHAFCLVRLVGSINDETKADDFSPESFYGAGLPEGISDDLGVTILDKMVSLGVNIHDTDYYRDKIIDASKEGALTFRTGNERFNERVKHHFNQT
jgi:hypothetical protein